MKVFIENEAGSFVKHIHDEKTLELKSTTMVSRPFLFPYGFVLNTTAEDGDNVDCYLLTNKKLRTGEIVDCEAVALMEQVEDGEIDHKVFAHLRGEPVVVLDEEKKAAFADFAMHVFEHIPGKRMEIGRFLDRGAALQYLEKHEDQPGQCAGKNGLFKIDL
jgi:inorganic pyrophosphatase